MTEAEIKQRVSADGHPFSDIFITHEGRRYYTRLPFPLTDTPHARAAQAQDFLRRQKRFAT